MNKITKYFLIATMVIFACSSCSKHKEQSNDTGVFMVSIEPQRWLLAQILSPDTQIGVLLPGGSDPETFDPTLNRRRQAENADIFFATGVLPYEDKLHSSVKRFVDTSEGITRIYGTHTHDHGSEGHSHAGAPDPHIWTSVSGARQMAVNMAGALCLAFPDSAEVYTHRLNSLLNRLDSIDQTIEAKVKGVDAFAIWHPSLSYFARDYGLHQIPLGQESKDLSAKQLKEAIDHAATDSVAVFFIQKEYDTRQAKAINDKIGSRLVVINPMAYEWDTEILNIADELSRR